METSCKTPFKQEGPEKVLKKEKGKTGDAKRIGVEYRKRIMWDP